MNGVDFHKANEIIDRQIAIFDRKDLKMTKAVLDTLNKYIRLIHQAKDFGTLNEYQFEILSFKLERCKDRTIGRLLVNK